jgi:hypothetical protein
VFTGCLVTASNAVNPSTSVFTPSYPRWLSPNSLQFPSWLPTAELSTQLGSTPLSELRVRVRIALRLTEYRQSVCLGAKPFKAHHQRSCFQLNTCGHSPYVASSLTRGCVCILRTGFALAKCTYSTYECY